MAVKFDNIKKVRVLVEGVEDRIKQGFQNALYEVCEAIVDITPVDEGTDSDGGLKANWQASVGGPAMGTIDDLDPDGDKTLGQIKPVTEQAYGDVFYLVNNAPYARVVEYGEYPNPVKKGTYLRSDRTKRGVSGPGYHIFSKDGYSGVAPQGIVEVSFKQFQTKLAKNLRDAAKS